MAFKAEKRDMPAPAGSLVWCCPGTADCCCGCSGCYDCCHKCSCCPDTCRCGPPCPTLFYWLPCCCCCCRPLEKEKHVEIVVEKEEEETFTSGIPEVEESAEEEPQQEKEEKETPVAAAAGIPRRRVVQKMTGKAKTKHHAAKSQPKMFTGAAAGTPPPPADACVGSVPVPPQNSTVPLGTGVYLIYKDMDEGGTLYLQWSKEALDGPGVLAYVNPAKEIADFKLTKKGGIEKLCTNLQKDMQSAFVTDRRKYYEGWATFFKQLEAYGGTVTLLPASDLQPPPRMRIVSLKGKKLDRMRIDSPFSKEQADLLAIVPDNATKFDVAEMEPAQFSAMAQNYGALVCFMPVKSI